MDFIDRFTRVCGDSKALAWLLIGNVGSAVLLWVAALVLGLCDIDSGVLYSLTALPSDPLSFALHPWTLLTYMFVHMSPLHLLFNMLWLFWFGRMLADIERPGTVLRLYLGAGVAGGVCYLLAAMLASYAPGAYLTGSSAAVLAVMCVTGMRFPDRSLNLFLLGEVKLKWIALVCILLTLVSSGGIPTQAAHLGGVAFGAVWFLTRRRFAVSRRSKAGKPFRQKRGSPYRRPAQTVRTVRQPVRINPRAAANAMRNSIPDHDRLDELLDKIRLSGYESLSAREKNELNYISTRIKS